MTLYSKVFIGKNNGDSKKGLKDNISLQKIIPKLGFHNP